MSTEPIVLISGGSFIPIDPAPFESVTYKVDPATLPDLPAGITLANDLIPTLASFGPRTGPNPTRDALEREIAIRTNGYLPRYDGQGVDQYGRDRDGFGPDGKNAAGYTREDLSGEDPFLETPTSPDQTDLANGQGVSPEKAAPLPRGRRVRKPPQRLSDAQRKARGLGNMKGRRIYARDGSRRTWGECWVALFEQNEILPPEHKRSDDDLIASMRKLFPHHGRDSLESYDPIYMRSYYNRGRMSGMDGRPPAHRSYRYMRDEEAGRVYRLNQRGTIVGTFDLPTGTLTGTRGQPPELPPLPQVIRAEAAWQEPLDAVDPDGLVLQPGESPDEGRPTPEQ